MRISYFWSSTMQGFYDDEGWYVARLNRDLMNINIQRSWEEDRDLFKLYLYADSGDTSSKILECMKKVFEIRSSDVVIVSPCLNDCIRYVADDSYKISVDQTKENLITMHTLCTDIGIRDGNIIYMWAWNIIESKTNPLMFKQSEYLLNKDRTIYDNLIKEHARLNGSVYIPRNDIDENCFFDDGIHYGPPWHKKVYEMTKPILFDIIWIK